DMDMGTVMVTDMVMDTVTDMDMVSIGQYLLL
ncbi:hypothetical protein AVEN_240913-1, partial [Araneus ventricosus]